MPHPNAFAHLPELQGRLTPASASGLRLTDEVLAEWDAQARSQGLPAHWRLPDSEVEQSRRDVLSTITAQQQDLWVFAYGSLMWNPGFHFAEVRRAHLPGYARRFSLGTTIGRGTPDCPGLVLTLEPDTDGACEGLVFRIPAPLVDAESRLLWRREMITGAYCPALLALPTPRARCRRWCWSPTPGTPTTRGACRCSPQLPPSPAPVAALAATATTWISSCGSWMCWGWRMGMWTG